MLLPTRWQSPFSYHYWHIIVPITWLHHGASIYVYSMYWSCPSIFLLAFSHALLLPLPNSSHSFITPLKNMLIPKQNTFPVCSLERVFHFKPQKQWWVNWIDSQYIGKISQTVNIHRKSGGSSPAERTWPELNYKNNLLEHHLLSLLCIFLLDLHSITMREPSSQCINTPSTLVSQKL